MASGREEQAVMAPRFQVKQSITFEEVLGESNRRLGDIARARTITGSMAAVTRYANLFRRLKRESPFVAEFIADDVKSMDVRGLREMERIKEGLVTEILARGDAGDRSYYTAPPEGQRL